MRYAVYYDDAHTSLIRGFACCVDVVSKQKMLGFLQHANWTPIYGHLHLNDAYIDIKSRASLVEFGQSPQNKPTLAEYNNAIETLEGPWWVSHTGSL
jgi:hypothetical protein